jgi:hypothetical protein
VEGGDAWMKDEGSARVGESLGKGEYERVRESRMRMGPTAPGAGMTSSGSRDRSAMSAG